MGHRRDGAALKSGCETLIVIPIPHTLLLPAAKEGAAVGTPQPRGHPTLPIHPNKAQVDWVFFQTSSHTSLHFSPSYFKTQRAQLTLAALTQPEQALAA